MEFWCNCFTCLLLVVTVACGRPQNDAKDECPQVKNLGDIKYKLRHMTLNGVERLCCTCNRGEKLTQLCVENDYQTTVCTPCERGTYIDEYAHNLTKCHIDNLVCPDDRIPVPSSPKEKPRCDCPDGNYITNDGKCERHSPCVVGYGVLIEGSYNRNTTCEKCPNGFASSNVSSTEKCKRIRDGNVGVTLAPSLVMNLTTMDATEAVITKMHTEPCQTDYVYHVLFGITFFILILENIVLYCCFKKKLCCFKKNKKPKKKKEEGKDEEIQPLHDSTADRVVYHADTGKDGDERQDDDSLAKPTANGDARTGNAIVEVNSNGTNSVSVDAVAVPLPDPPTGQARDDSLPQHGTGKHEESIAPADENSALTGTYVAEPNHSKTSAAASNPSKSADQTIWAETKKKLSSAMLWDQIIAMYRDLSQVDGDQVEQFIDELQRKNCGAQDMFYKVLNKLQLEQPTLSPKDLEKCLLDNEMKSYSQTVREIIDKHTETSL